MKNDIETMISTMQIFKNSAKAQHTAEEIIEAYRNLEEDNDKLNATVDLLMSRLKLQQKKYTTLLSDFKYVLTRLYFESVNGWNTNSKEGAELSRNDTIADLAHKYELTQNDILGAMSDLRHGVKPSEPEDVGNVVCLKTEIVEQNGCKAEYTLYRGDTEIGKITIPKDIIQTILPPTEHAEVKYDKADLNKYIEENYSLTEENNTKTHTIKILKDFADAVVAGEKTFEIRENDRGFQKGDYVKFQSIRDGISDSSHSINDKIVSAHS